jgi:divalent metal cation (Fe/Co/Zn/Cd) transporter
VVVLVAALVALTARLAQALPDRFTWALPSAAALVGLLMIAVAGSLARALQDRRR